MKGSDHMITTDPPPWECPGLKGSKHCDGRSPADDLPHVDVQNAVSNIQLLFFNKQTNQEVGWRSGIYNSVSNLYLGESLSDISLNLLKCCGCYLV